LFCHRSPSSPHLSHASTQFANAAVFVVSRQIVAHPNEKKKRFHCCLVQKEKKKKKCFRAITQIKKNILHVHVIGYISTMEDKKINSDLEDKVF
jgi:hypothetical protein